MTLCYNFAVQVIFVLWYFIKGFLHIFGYLFLCKYFDNIRLINRKMELYYIGKYLKGEGKRTLQADQLPISNFKVYFFKSNAMQN